MHDKSRQLIRERGVSFENVVFLILQGDIMDNVKQPNPEKSPCGLDALERAFALSVRRQCFVH